jgi:hypothetical protein
MDGEQHFKQENDNGSVPGDAPGPDEGTRKSVIVKREPDHRSITDSPTSDQRMSGEESGNDDEMEKDEEEESCCVHREHDCGLHSDKWGNDLLKRIFTSTPDDLWELFCASTELSRKSDDSLQPNKPDDLGSSDLVHGTLPLGTIFLMTNPEAYAMKALGLNSFVGSAELEITAEGGQEVDGATVTLFDHRKVFKAITELGRPDKHIPTHDMWCGTHQGEDEGTAKDWNRPFNRDRLRSQADVLEWNLGTIAGVVIEDGESEDEAFKDEGFQEEVSEDEESEQMSMIDLKVVLRARSDRNFVLPWVL